MADRLVVFSILAAFSIFLQPINISAQSAVKDTVIAEMLIYHPIHLNSANQTILPWYSSNPGKSYDFIINRVWNFWNTMRVDKNGLPYYMNHQVWRGDFNDRRGIGGDQFAMALSSWNLLYGYSGDESVKEEIKFIADYYLTNSLSPSYAAWPDIPYPYNTLIYSGIYDGDMIIGKDFTQPDKAGSFGFELVKIYKMTSTDAQLNISDNRYMDAAVKIANTLAMNIIAGDTNNSPLPFKVNTITGEIGRYINYTDKGEVNQLSSYTSNWSGTMELFLSLIELKAGDTGNYRVAFDKLLNWMKNFPLKTNKWGPFFEDVPGWSDTQINAVTFAQFMMNYPEYFPNWKSEVKGIFSWVYENLGNKEWEKYGVVVVNEQTAYTVPGNSHTSRQASAELQYAALTGEMIFIKNAIRQLNWASYMVDDDGKNCYPRDEVWMTDGYGDYVRHYLRAMAFLPELAPADQNHLLSTTSVIQFIEYPPFINKFMGQKLSGDEEKKLIARYRTFDEHSMEIFRITNKPESVSVNGNKIPETNNQEQEGWSWKPLEIGGLLTVRHWSGNNVNVMSYKE